MVSEVFWRSTGRCPSNPAVAEISVGHDHHTTARARLVTSACVAFFLTGLNAAPRAAAERVRAASGGQKSQESAPMMPSDAPGVRQSEKRLSSVAEAHATCQR